MKQLKRELQRLKILSFCTTCQDKAKYYAYQIKQIESEIQNVELLMMIKG